MQLRGRGNESLETGLTTPGLLLLLLLQKKSPVCKCARLLSTCACVPGAGVLLSKVREFDRRNFALGFM